ncbi:MAG: prenyltransferase [Candidatus Gastranaerophilales bacterium]|nr:prenyltransferase [Candidatus Gastranaerophilales bacterium]
MIARIKFWLECSRWYALPMSFMAWLVIFIYGLDNDGNFINGILALIGICFAHLAANLFDDFIDFRNPEKYVDENNYITLQNTQKGKCGYLLNNSVRLSDVIKVAGLYCFTAFIIGLYLYYAAGAGVLFYMVSGGLIVLLYPFMSNHRLSELAVALAYGPILFGGVYYTMTSHCGIEPFVLALPIMIFTVNLLFTDTFMDREIDRNEGKNTFVNLFRSDISALNFQKSMLFSGYLSVFLAGIFDITDWEIFITYLTIPLAVDLINSLKLYSESSLSVPNKKWYHFPFENWDKIEKGKTAPFMFRMYQARNLMIYFSVLLAVSVYFD